MENFSAFCSEKKKQNQPAFVYKVVLVVFIFLLFLLNGQKSRNLLLNYNCPEDSQSCRFGPSIHKKTHETLKYFPFLTVVKVGRNVKRSITPIPMMRGYEIMMKYLVNPKSLLSLIKYYYLYLAFLIVILRKFVCSMTSF